MVGRNMSREIRRRCMRCLLWCLQSRRMCSRVWYASPHGQSSSLSGWKRLRYSPVYACPVLHCMSRPYGKYLSPSLTVPTFDASSWRIFVDANSFSTMRLPSLLYYLIIQPRSLENHNYVVLAVHSYCSLGNSHLILSDLDASHLDIILTLGSSLIA